MGDEIRWQKDGTYHAHVYAVFSAVRFSTPKRFQVPHILKKLSLHSSDISMARKVADRIRLTLNTEKYKKCWRDLEVTYIFGKTGAGNLGSLWKHMDTKCVSCN